VRRMAQLPPLAPFRSSFRYSTLSFMAAGQAASKHSPHGWPGFIRERILEPLQMSKATFTSTEALKNPNHAAAHRPNRAGKLEVIDWYSQQQPHDAGSVYTNVTDLAKWLQFQLGDGSWKGRRLVSSTNLEETHMPNTIIPMSELSKAWSPNTVQLCYCMGWVLQDYRGVKMLIHGGFIDGFKALLVLLPAERIGIGILANHHATNMNLAAAYQIMDLMLGNPASDWNSYFGTLTQAEEVAKKEANARRERERNANEKPSLPLAEYAGAYENPAYGECQVKVEGSQLYWHWSSFREALEYYRHDTFELKNIHLYDTLIEFVVEDGRVRNMKFGDVVFCKKK
jgi:CubicO group peptidase (beta-lactamase class C family)